MKTSSRAAYRRERMNKEARQQAMKKKISRYGEAITYLYNREENEIAIMVESSKRVAQAHK